MGKGSPPGDTNDYVFEKFKEAMEQNKFKKPSVLKINERCVLQDEGSNQSIRLFTGYEVSMLEKLKDLFDQSNTQNFPRIVNKVVVPTNPLTYVALCREPVHTSVYILPKDAKDKNLVALAFQILFAYSQMSKNGIYPDVTKGYSLRLVPGGKIVYFDPKFSGGQQLFTSYTIETKYMVIFNGFVRKYWFSAPSVNSILLGLLGEIPEVVKDNYRRQDIALDILPCVSFPNKEDPSKYFLRPTFFTKAKSPNLVGTYIPTIVFVKDILTDYILGFQAHIAREVGLAYPDIEDLAYPEEGMTRRNIDAYYEKWFAHLKQSLRECEKEVLIVRTIDPESVVAEELGKAVENFRSDLKKYEKTLPDEYESVLSFQNLVESFECAQTFADFIFALIDLKYYPTVDLRILEPYDEDLFTKLNWVSIHYEKIKKIEGSEQFRQKALSNIQNIWNASRLDSLKKIIDVITFPATPGMISKTDFIERVAKLGVPRCDDDREMGAKAKLFVKTLNIMSSIASVSLFNLIVYGARGRIREIDEMRKEMRRASKENEKVQNVLEDIPSDLVREAAELGRAENKLITLENNVNQLVDNTLNNPTPENKKTLVDNLFDIVVEGFKMASQVSDQRAEVTKDMRNAAKNFENQAESDANRLVNKGFDPTTAQRMNQASETAKVLQSESPEALAFSKIPAVEPLVSPQDRRICFFAPPEALYDQETAVNDLVTHYQGLMPKGSMLDASCKPEELGVLPTFVLAPIHGRSMAAFERFNNDAKEMYGPNTIAFFADSSFVLGNEGCKKTGVMSKEGNEFVPMHVDTVWKLATITPRIVKDGPVGERNRKHFEEAVTKILKVT